MATGNAALEWDAENRLIKVTRADTTVITYAYDYQSRRISKNVGGGTADHYIYDGWNLIAEYAGTTLNETYTWGMDLSGSMQGAGGVGGLLAVDDGSAAYYPTYDGNGNVSEYLDSSGADQAHYEYDAFGNTTVSTGTKVGDFQHRFSTKSQDAETGLYYYGYRYYDPVTGRWPSRDPIEEDGGENLYGFAGNNPIAFVDWYGLKVCHTERIDYRIGEKRFDLWKIKGRLFLDVRGSFTVCDDCTKTLTGSIVGGLSGEIDLSPPWFLTASGDVRGTISATWDEDGFKSGSGDLKLVGWIGGGLKGGSFRGQDLVKLTAEGGLDTSFDFDVDGDEDAVNVDVTGGPVNVNARARLKVGYGRWSYNQEIFRVSKEVGKAPDFDFSIDLPNTVP